MAPMIEVPVRQGWWLRPLAALGRRLLLVPEGALLPTLFCLHIVLGRSPLLALAGLLVSGVFLARTALLMLAMRALDAGAYARAGRLARWALRLHPLSADGLALQGLVHRGCGDLPAAQTCLRKANEVFPGHGGLHAELSAALADSGDVAPARAHALYALLLSPERPCGYLRLADLSLRADGAVAEACHLARRGVLRARRPAEQAHLQVLLAEGQARLGDRRSMECALAAAAEQLAECPAMVQAELLYRIGQLRRREGDVDDATACLQRIATADPEGRYVGLAWRALRELER